MSAGRVWLFAFAVGAAALVWRAMADIVYRGSGNMQFDADKNGSSEMVLNTTGLGLGTTSPSTNLHVQGNVFLNGNLGLGTTAPASTLMISGALALLPQTVTTNATLSGNSFVAVDTSAGNITLTLPPASSSNSRFYQIKKVSSASTLYITGSPIDNESELRLTTSTNGFPAISIISDGNQWYALSRTDGIVGVSTSNLLGWWQFEETSGTTAKDSSGSGRDGSLVGGFTFSSNTVAGPIGQALDFDGVDDHVYIAHDTALNVSNVTMAVWVKVDAFNATWQNIMGKGDSGTGCYRIVRLGDDAYQGTGNSVGFTIQGDTQTFSASSNILDSQWHHVAGTYDRVKSRLYIDGTEVANRSFTTAIPATTANVLVGHLENTNNNRHHDGKLDDVRIYGRALTAAEILELYRAGKK